MLEILKFIFSSFWVFAGTVVLVAVTGDAVQGIVSAIVKWRRG